MAIMYNLSETNQTSNSVWNNLPLYILYIVEFLTIGIGNVILAVAIARYKALRSRKEYVVLFGLFLADSISLSAYFAAGTFIIIFRMCNLGTNHIFRRLSYKHTDYGKR